MMRKVVECDMGEDSSIQYYFWLGMRICHMTRDVTSDLSRQLTVIASQMTALQKDYTV